MKQRKTLQPAKVMTKTAVLLIPEPENAGEDPIFGIKPGYYDSAQLLKLVLKHKDSVEAVRYIADMLETGNAKDDGFAKLLRKNQNNPVALVRTVESCKE